MAYVGTPLDTTNAFQSLAGKRFSGDASTTDFTLDSSPNSTLDIEVFVENVRQDPNSAYTVSGTTLGFTAAPPSGTNNIYVVHQAKAVGTINIPDDTLNSQTDIGGAIADADLFLIDDGAGGTLRKTAASRLKTYVGGPDPSSADGDSLGTASAEWSDLYLADGGVIYFGNDQDINITHVADTGLTTNGTITANAGLKADNITIDGTEIDLSSGSLTVDSAGNITLDCGTGELLFNNADNGNLLKIQADSSNVNIIAMVQDKDIVFKGDDGGSSITPVSIDMSEGGKLKVTGGTSGDNICDFDHTLNGSAYGPVFKTSGVANDNNTTYFLTCVDSSAVRMRLYSDGDLINHDNSYGAISDERIKQDIVDATSQWDDIKALKIRHYKKKDDVVTYKDKAQKELGVIAQELEASGMNGLVKPEVTYKDYDADVRNGIVKEGDVKDYKSVKYSILYMKAIKCLQEAITKIETLETETTALKARVKTLEDA